MTTATQVDLDAQRAALACQLADLRAKWPGLALAAARGGVATSMELDELEAEIARAERALKHLSLAAGESQRLATLDRQAAAAEERQRLERGYRSAVEQRQTAYRAVEAAAATLAEQVQRAIASGDALQVLADQTRHPAAAYPTRLELAEYLLTGLSIVLPGVIPFAGRPRQHLADPITIAGANT